MAAKVSTFAKVKDAVSGVAGVTTAVYYGNIFWVSVGVSWGIIPAAVLGLLCFAAVYGALSFAEDHIMAAIDFVSDTAETVSNSVTDVCNFLFN